MNAFDAALVACGWMGAVIKLLGTTAAKVVNHAPCTVLVVHERAETRKEN